MKLYAIFCSLLLLSLNKYKSPQSKTPFNLFHVKSGVINYHLQNNDILGYDQNIILYFDDYGNKELIKSTMILDTIVINNTVIKIDTIQYTMVDTLQCIKSNRKKEFSLNNIEFGLIHNEKELNEMGIKKNGQLDFLGKKCTQYLINAKDGTTGEIVEWQNIPLSIWLKNNNSSSNIQATKIDTALVIPVTTFDLPKKIRVIDFTHSR